MAGDSNKPTAPVTAPAWDDDRPTIIVMDPNAGKYPSGAEPVARPADETDEHPVVLAHEVQALTELPSFLEAHLDVIGGPHPTGSFKLSTVRTLIGRGQTADIRLYDTKMSKEHASIVYRGSEFRIRDERSTNGTFLNGSRVVEYVIRDSDKLLIGDSLLRFRIRA